MAVVKFNNPGEFLAELKQDCQQVDRGIVRVTNLYRGSTVSPSLHTSASWRPHGLAVTSCVWTATAATSCRSAIKTALMISTSWSGDSASVVYCRTAAAS